MSDVSSASAVAGASTASARSVRRDALISLERIGKMFGSVNALNEVSFDFFLGECVGIAGHNGAGKSTLMAVLAGVFAPDHGTLTVDGQVQQGYDANVARAAGVHCVLQELSLCANLSVAENMCVVHPSLRGPRWRRRARELMREQLDVIFPGHGLQGDELVADLSLTQRQMVEIARSFTVVDEPLRLVILDEPTSSLDAHTASQLLTFIRAAAARGIASILISHMLGEIERVADRVMVMRDGSVAAVLPREGLTQDAIIRAMGQHDERSEAQDAAGGRETTRNDSSAFEWRVGVAGTVHVSVMRGEVVAFAGLAGQGQTEALLEIHRAATRQRTRQRVAFVAGDRARDGVFPLWSIAQNLDIRWLFGGLDEAMRDADAAARGAGRGRSRWFIRPSVTARIAQTWRERIGIRGAAMHDGILSLSGGNQQKVLFARALASDAELILMDDPTRGVDIGTKRDIYRLVRDEAARGRTFVWYTTENDELAYCDRTYVFRGGCVTRVLDANECDEASLLAASFEEVAA